MPKKESAKERAANKSAAAAEAAGVCCAWAREPPLEGQPGARRLRCCYAQPSQRRAPGIAGTHTHAGCLSGGGGPGGADASVLGVCCRLLRVALPPRQGASRGTRRADSRAALSICPFASVCAAALFAADCDRASALVSRGRSAGGLGLQSCQRR